MARLTLDALMAPGGLLDAGSRLTQTLVTVPFEREQYRGKLEAEALGREREDQRIVKTDKIGYLKDRINTVSQRVNELRRALSAGDTADARITLAALKKGGLPTGLGKGATDALNAALKDAQGYEVEQRKALISKVGEKLSSANEQELASRTDKFFNDSLARVKKQYPDDNWGGGQAAGGLSAAALEMAKQDPQMQAELDHYLDEQSQLFDQYRKLVGHAEATTDVRRFLKQSMPDLAPQQKGLDPESMQLPPGAPHPDDAFATGNAAAPTGPATVPQFGRAAGAPPAVTTAPKNAREGFLRAQMALASPEAIAASRAAAAKAQQEKRGGQMLDARSMLAARAGVDPTPENLDAIGQILATVAPSGQDALALRLQQDASNAQTPRMVVSGSSPGGMLSWPQGRAPLPQTAPDMPAVLVPRIQQRLRMPSSAP
jgi:hypothetical protein